MKMKVLNIEFEYNGTIQIISPVIMEDEHNMVLVDTGYSSQIELFDEVAKKK